MLGLNTKLKEYEAQGKKIRVGLVGAGQMGKGMVSQMTKMHAMMPAIVADINVQSAIEAFNNAGIDAKDVVQVNTLEEANKFMAEDKYIVTSNSALVSQATLVDVVVDATGSPDVGARIALDTILNKKHIVMLNVETDVVIGPILKKLAVNAGVIYTGTAGDEPGSVRELYDFADGMGFEVVAIGKGKNNPVNLESTPDSCREQAEREGVAPKMLCEFKDGTKTMIEMAAMANSMGFIPDVRGAHAAVGGVEDLTKIFRLKEEGGVLNKYGIVDYVNGVAPGVFIVVTTDNDQIHHELQYLSMGEGPNYTFYRPYHLTSLETPLTAARCVLYNEPTIQPMDGPLVAEVITIAKKDLHPGDKIDGLGQYTVYASIDTYETAKKERLLPIGLAAGATITKEVKKGQEITYDMVDLDKSTLIYKLRELQELLIG
ncbi:NAD(P)H-dependent oxidoreductase [Fusibacter ferrireducens]|uniref:NAD(P)-dependent oxidoreductase n=1 Tax=Fusibacter ferrireducens TaxID=2785058 RepID=A0ABR9ZV21_9FIRM|nr:NAD(P)-dependent oxidoreductase [Fusibacter ferrireducens]MBF4694314.1 NAD(P)-dependent oxidoreductase [Fusibacter ferrireducens]